MNRTLATVVLASLFFPRMSIGAPAEPLSKRPTSPLIVEVTFKDDISEEPSALALDGEPVSDSLRAILDTLSKARDDNDVKGLVIRVKGLSIGLGKVHELRRGLAAFRSSGKKAVAVLEKSGNAEYLVAAAADEVVMPESGCLMIKGLAAEVTFYKAMFDKVGVTAETVQVGEFKGAGEPYSRTAMSGRFREELTAVLNDNYTMMAEAIASRQGITVADAKTLIEDGPYTPHGARKVGLINRVAYEDQVSAELAQGLRLTDYKVETKYGKKSKAGPEASGLAGFMKMMQALSGEWAKAPESKAPKIALIYATGMIQTGKSSEASVLGAEVLGSDTVIKNLRKVSKDKTVKRIVLRVDSPGGSAVASDLIWREISRLEKPIVASMSDVAASGGYYISMGCDKVYAEPGTLTGSIGVISVKLAIGKMLEKVGVTTDTVTVGKNGVFESTVASWTDTERKAMRRLSEEVYKQFVGKAAKGRKMEFAQLEKKAGGRVYTGRQAKAEGLVDEVGTLEDATTEAKHLAGISGNEKLELLVLPRPQSLLETLLSPVEERDRETSTALSMLGLNPATALPEALRGPLARFSRLTRLLSTEPAVLLAPYELKIR